MVQLKWSDHDPHWAGRTASVQVEDIFMQVSTEDPSGFYRWDGEGPNCGLEPTIADAKFAAEKWLARYCSQQMGRIDRILTALQGDQDAATAGQGEE